MFTLFFIRYIIGISIIIIKNGNFLKKFFGILIISFEIIFSFICLFIDYKFLKLYIGIGFLYIIVKMIMKD